MIWFDSSNRVLDATYDILNVTSLEDVKNYYAKYSFAQSPLESSVNHWSDALAPGIVNQIEVKNQSATRPISVVINSMNLYRLDRKSAGATLSCLLNNSDLAPSIRRTVQIDLNCKCSDGQSLPNGLRQTRPRRSP